MGSPGLLAEPIFYQGFFCSDLGREEISRIQSVIHEGQEPLVRTKVFPFELVELPSECSCLLNSTFFEINEWCIHVFCFCLDCCRRRILYYLYKLPLFEQSLNPLWLILTFLCP